MPRRMGESSSAHLKQAPDAPATAAAGERPGGRELVERLRTVHLEMVDAVLSGEGLVRVAELTARAVDGTVAIVVPQLGAVHAWPAADAHRGLLAELDRYVSERVKGAKVRRPESVLAEVPITAGDEMVGAVLRLACGAALPTEGGPADLDFLHLAAVASLTEVAVFEAREQVEQNLRGSFMEELRTRSDLEAAEVVRRAGRLGCDLSRGAVVLCAELHRDRPGHLTALVGGEYPGALAQLMDNAAPGAPARMYALLPAVGEGEEVGGATLGQARQLATRLGRHGTVGVSSFCSDPAGLGRAMAEAELMLDVLRQSDGANGLGAQDIGTGTYRLLFRVLASHPEEVRAFYQDTVAAIVRYDDQYRTELVTTLEAYLEQNCNMNATAAAIYAHRHTVAYRLDRIRELTGLDPMQSEDRERLGLGLKAYRIIAPQLPK